MTHRTHSGLPLWAMTLAPASTLVSPALLATDYPTSDYLTGSWGGARDRWSDQGFRFNPNYTSESMANVSGGEVLGGTYADNIGLDVIFDLQRLLGIRSTTLLVKGSKRDGHSVSEKFITPSEGGNAFPVQELYGGQNVKLVNVQFNTRLLDDRLDLASGRLIANDDFLRSDLYCQFLNNSFCGSPKPVFYQNPFTFSAYPVAAWARGRVTTPSRESGPSSWRSTTATSRASVATPRARATTPTVPAGAGATMGSPWPAKRHGLGPGGPDAVPGASWC